MRKDYDFSKGGRNVYARRLKRSISIRSGAALDNALNHKETMHVQSEPKIYKPGQWVILGTVLGAFIGLLLGKFAIGLIFGFFAGIMIDSAKRKASKAGSERGTGDDAKDQAP